MSILSKFLYSTIVLYNQMKEDRPTLIEDMKLHEHQNKVNLIEMYEANK